ncbi:MAG: ATP-grasp domain-containing protein [Chitinophagales bacterium]
MGHNILITSAGRRVSLVRIFRKELQKKFPGSKIIAVDSNPELSAACKVADVSLRVPPADHKEYVEALLEFCSFHDVGMMIPTIDTELQTLSDNKMKLLEKGITCVVSEPGFISVCRNKIKVIDFFIEKNISTLKQYNKHALTYPVIVKPVSGSASKNIFIAQEKIDIPEKVFAGEDFIYLPYLDPKKFSEYTVDLYYSKDYKLKCVVPRKRLEVREGEVSKAITIKNKICPYLFEKIEYLEGVQGVINLQLFYNEKEGQLFASEINPRFGGGYPLSFHSGANFPAMLIEEYYFSKTITYTENWKENIMMLRYDDEIIFENND